MGTTGSRERGSQEVRVNAASSSAASGPPSYANRQQQQASPQPQFQYLSPQEYMMMFGPSPMVYGPGQRGMPQGQMPIFYVPRAQPPPPQVQQTITIRNDVNLKKNSMRLVPVADDSPSSSTRFRISFTLDLAVDAIVKVFFACSEAADPDGTIRFYPLVESSSAPSMKYPRGLGQQYTQSNVLDLSVFHNGTDLLYNPALRRFPIIVVLETIADPSAVAAALSASPSIASSSSSSLSPSSPRILLGSEPFTRPNVQSQFTYATLQRNSDGTWTVKPLKQKIQVNGQSYELQEIYGIESSQSGGEGENGGASGGSGASAGGGGGDEESSLCVICMTDPRDTTVLPCRHMCLCSECAKTLRLQTNKCPICRTLIESLLQIKVSRGESKSSPATPGGPPAV